MKVLSIVPYWCSILLVSLEANGFSSGALHTRYNRNMGIKNTLPVTGSASFGFPRPKAPFILLKMSNHHVEEADEDIEDGGYSDSPIPFVDVQNNNFIECYTESVATVKGVQYTIGVPCDHAVALCSFDTDDQLVPIDLDDPLMDDVYPVAERYIVSYACNSSVCVLTNSI